LGLTAQKRCHGSANPVRNNSLGFRKAKKEEILPASKTKKANHWRRLVKNIGWANQNIEGKGVKK